MLFFNYWHFQEGWDECDVTSLNLAPFINSPKVYFFAVIKFLFVPP